MDDSSLDFLDQLVPGTPGSEGGAAPSMRQSKRDGRSLPPAPPSVVAASRGGRGDVDIDIDVGSASEHDIPAEPTPTSHVPMPEGKARSGWPAAASAASRPPPPPSLRAVPQSLSQAPLSSLATAAEPASAPVASAPPPAPPRRAVSLAPPPPPPLKTSFAPPPPPRPTAPALSDDADADEADEMVDAVPDSDDFTPHMHSGVSEYEDETAAEDDDADEDALPTGVAHPVPEVEPVPAARGASFPAPPMASAYVTASSHPGASHNSTFAAGASAPPLPPSQPMVVGSSLPPPPPVAASGPPLPLPPPPASSARPAPNFSAASEWDEMPTTVYARDSLRPSEMPYAGRPVVSSLPAAPTVPGIRAPRIESATAPRPERKKLWFGAAAAAAAAVAGIAIVGGSSEGNLVINVAGADGIALDGIKVFVDGKLVCEDSPCQVNNLDSDGHVMMAQAEGYLDTPATAVLVKGGETTIQNVELVKAKSGTGLSIPKSVGEIILAIDGKEVGPLPQRLDDLEPGTHTLRFTGSERFEPLEKTVELSAGNVLALEPLKLPVRKGIAKFEAGEHAEDAEITLDGKPIDLPYSAELSGRKTHTLVASKEGFHTFEEEFSFEPGEPELELTVTLQPEASVEEIDADETAVASAPQTQKRSSVRRSSSSRKSSSSRSSSKGSGGGTLTLLSVPASMVILDGKPIGKTPKRAMSVSAGSHSVVFVHPSKGRKRASAKVTSGGSKTVAVRF